MLASMLDRLRWRFTPGTYDGLRAGLAPVDSALVSQPFPRHELEEAKQSFLGLYERGRAKARSLDPDGKQEVVRFSEGGLDVDFTRRTGRTRVYFMAEILEPAPDIEPWHVDCILLYLTDVDEERHRLAPGGTLVVLDNRGLHASSYCTSGLRVVPGHRAPVPAR
jgi:hypothetical protein